MGNDTPTTDVREGQPSRLEVENQELHERVERLEALVGLLGERMDIHHNAIADPNPEMPDIDRMLAGEYEALQGHTTLTTVWEESESDRALGAPTPWAVTCYCNWQAGTMTEEEAVLRARHHEETFHRDYKGAAGPSVSRREDRGEAAA